MEAERGSVTCPMTELELRESDLNPSCLAPEPAGQGSFFTVSPVVGGMEAGPGREGSALLGVRAGYVEVFIPMFD